MSPLNPHLVDLRDAPRRAWRNMITGYWWRTLLLFDAAVLLLIFFGAETSFFWTLFLAFLLFKWNSRYVGALAILALTACPILLSLELPGDAESFAVYAYYFLVITVVLQIIEYRREAKAIILGPGLPEEWTKGKNFVVDLRPKGKHPSST